MKIKKNVFLISIAALFTAIICVFSQISVLTPFGIPVTLQIFAVALCGYFLGAKWGLASTAVYILLGAVGLPVFSGFKGGFQALFGPTGGFILGFLCLTALCGLSLKTQKSLLKILFGVIGVLLCHICGIIQYSIISEITLFSAFITASLPFLLKDIILTVLALFLSHKLKKLLNI